MRAVRVELVETTPPRAEALAAAMRPEDAAEVLASGGWTPAEAVRHSLNVSDWARTLLLDGEVAAIYGVAALPRPSLLSAPDGVVWLLTSTVVERHRKTFARLSRAALAALLERWPRLCNAIDARYAAALRWARWLGAEVQPAVPFGAQKLPFHPVIWRAHV